VEGSDKSRDHSALLTLLDSLVAPATPKTTTFAFDPKSPDTLLALARHAAALARAPKLSPEFLLRVHSETKEKNGLWHRFDRFSHWPIERFLDSGPNRPVLIGLPGAGKTYSLRRAAARLSNQLHEACLADKPNEANIIVPILADLKLYRGDVAELVSQTLPRSLPFQELIRHFKVKVFLDSFNEMSREFWESGSYEADFQTFLKDLGQASLVIGSRTTDGLAKLDLPSYGLDEIDEGALSSELQRLKIKLKGRFSPEVHSLLQRPFYFQHILSGDIVLPMEAHPRDFYRCFFDNLSNAFRARFNAQIDIVGTLSLTAYGTLDRGEEAFPLAELLRILTATFEEAGVSGLEARDVANWLVSVSMLMPYSGNRVAFVHQALTEYLAAKELARRYLKNAKTLKEKLKLIRWDQALFLTLSLLPAVNAELFLQDVTKADFALALNAAKYLEEGREEVISKLLAEVPRHCVDYESTDDWKAGAAISFGLPITNAHEPQLWAIVKCGSMLGAAAVERLASMKGQAVKAQLMQLLFDCRDDYVAMGSHQLCNRLHLRRMQK
jgi:hypothetical protein